MTPEARAKDALARRRGRTEKDEQTRAQSKVGTSGTTNQDPFGEKSAREL